MSESSQHLDIDDLRAAYPGYDFERDPRRDPPRYCAVARDLGTHPRCVISDDLAEIWRELAVGQG